MAERADVIIVGAGLAGSAAALAIARAGRRPVLVDPKDGSAGDPAGSGIIGSRDLTEELRGTFPYDRRLVDRRLAFLGAASLVSIEFQEPAGGAGGPPTSFLRARTDPWLAEASVSAGAERRTGRVDGLSRNGGAVDGIILDGSPLTARLTILADGPRAGELADGLAPGPAGSASRAVTVATDRLSLAASRIEARFDLSPETGTSIHGLLGWVAAPAVASGFLVTHRDSITVGVRISGAASPEAATALRSAFQAHSGVAPLLGGGVPVPGAARVALVPSRRRPLGGPGWLLAGDSAGLPGFSGAVLRGRNSALRSGWLAGAATGPSLARPTQGPLRAASAYEHLLRTEGIGAEGPASADPLIGDPRIHGAYPDLLATALHRLMTETGGPKEPVTAALRGSRRSSGRTWRAIARDATGALRRL